MAGNCSGKHCDCLYPAKWAQRCCFLPSGRADRIFCPLHMLHGKHNNSDCSQGYQLLRKEEWGSRVAGRSPSGGHMLGPDSGHLLPCFPVGWESKEEASGRLLGGLSVLRGAGADSTGLNKQLSILPLPGPPGQKTLVIKSCAYTCPGFQESLSYSRASCCNTDLCNSTMSPSASWGLLALSVLGAYLIR